MVFNPFTTIDFQPQFVLEDNEIEVVDEMRVLGLVIRSDMKLSSNTQSMVSRDNKKLWVVRRLKKSGAKTEVLVDVYCKQVRSLLELAVPAWHGSITLAEGLYIKRIQKSACHIILGEEYFSYKNALKAWTLTPLHSEETGCPVNLLRRLRGIQNRRTGLN